jgi:RecA-family ATPase
MADVLSKEVEWLCPPYIPSSKVILLEGDPESGKTFLAIEIAAAVTTGRRTLTGIPVEGDNSSVGTGANVLYFTGEDDIADTLRPRFEKQGGNTDLFYAVQGMVEQVNGEKIHTSFTLSCVQELERALAELKPALVIIDPLQAFLGAKVDMHRSNEVRPVMAGLAELAADHKCAILVIRHLNKAGQGKALYRGMGSIDFSAAARSILLAGKDPEDQERFVLVHNKSSLGPKGEALTYEIDDKGLHITGITNVTAEDLLFRMKEMVQPVDQAVNFLRDQLATGPKSRNALGEAAALQGIKFRTLERAGKRLGIMCSPSGFGGPWLWHLSTQQVLPASDTLPPAQAA